ncbi:MAG: diguanylate cyclase, partial [Sphingomonas sp.]
MSKQSIPAADQTQIDFPTLIGLRDGADAAQWGRIRATQLHAGRQLAMFLLAANLIGAAMTASLFAGDLPTWKLAVWAALVAVIAVGVAMRRLASPHRGDGYANVRDIRATVVEGAALAVAWAIPPLLFEPSTGSTTAYALWMILSVLMTAAAVAMAPLALATIMFLAGLCLAVVVKLALIHAYAAAGTTILFTALLIIACIGRARSLVAIRASQIALAERNETVSLLLREFEDNGADWLWETDSARRVIKASPRFAFACGLDP